MWLSEWFRRNDGAGVVIDSSVIAASLLAICLLAGVFIRTGIASSDDIASHRFGGPVVLQADDKLIAFEDFEHGAVGWEGGEVTDAASGFSGILGLFGGTYGLEGVTKTFRLSNDHQFTIVEFELHAIDDWQLEEISLFINGETVVTRSFATRPELVQRQATQISDNPQFRISVTPRYASPEDRGFGAVEDQTLAVRISINNPGAMLSIGFGSNLLPDNSQAFWAVDNLRVTATDHEVF